MLLREMTEEEIITYLKQTKPNEGIAPSRKLANNRHEAMDELIRRDMVNAKRK